MKESRIRLTSLNIVAGFVGKILTLLLSFASRTVFIYFLGVECLGISGLYSNILSVLSFAELGFGSAMTFALYKPVADNNEELVCQLLDYFRRVYRFVALFIAVVGLILIPLLPFIVKVSGDISSTDLIIYYVLYLLNSVISYFVTYKYSYVNAIQKTYVTTNIETILTIITSAAQLAVIAIFKSFLAYLITQTVCLGLSRLIIALYLNKKYPKAFHKSAVKLPKENKQGILKNVKGLIVHRLSSIAIYSTDNIIISSIISVVIVGLVSNYTLIISSINAFLTILFSAFIAPLGNIYATETKDFFFSWYKKINFLNFWMYGFCSIALFVLLPSFITLWIGGDKLIDTGSLILIIIDNYLLGQSAVYENARNVIGDFNKDKWWSVAQAVTNIIVSIPCAMYMGLLGVYIGTIVSRLVYVLFKPTSTFRTMFDRPLIKNYYPKLFLYFAIVVVSCVCTYFATQPILQKGGWGWFFLGCLIVAIMPNVVFFLLTFWTDDFKETKALVINRIKGLKR